MKVLTSQFFSKIYYSAIVWMGHLSSRDVRRIESLHYQALWISCYDFRNDISRIYLDHDLKCSTPSEWKNYSLAREGIRIYTSGVPTSLFEQMDSQSYVVNRPLSKKFFEKCNRKIGKQCIRNKMAGPLNMTAFDWFHNYYSSDAQRTLLKYCFFKYPSSASSFSITECRRIKMRLKNIILIARTTSKSYPQPALEPSK